MLEEHGPETCLKVSFLMELFCRSPNVLQGPVNILYPGVLSTPSTLLYHRFAC